MCALTRAGRVTHSVSLRLGCKKQSLSLDGPRCRDWMLPLFPLFLISPGRTVIFDIVEYIIIECTMPIESQICKLCRPRRVLILSSCCCKRVNTEKNNKHSCVQLTNLAGWDLKLNGWDYDFWPDEILVRYEACYRVPPITLWGTLPPLGVFEVYSVWSRKGNH